MNSCKIELNVQETMEVYHSNPAWGSSVISDFIKSPLLAHWKKSGRIKNKPTAAMELGTAFHSLAQGTFNDEYSVGPDVDKRTKAWKTAVTESDKILITAGDFNILNSMHDSLKANPYAAALLDGAEYETTFRMKYKNLSIQCRSDALHKWSHIVDIKTTQDIDGFEKSVINFGYFRQAALYRYIISQACGKTLPFTFIACEKQAPYRTRVFDLTDEFLQIGWEQVEHALDNISKCIDSGVWNEQSYQQIPPPRWLAA